MATSHESEGDVVGEVEPPTKPAMPKWVTFKDSSTKPTYHIAPIKFPAKLRPLNPLRQPLNRTGKKLTIASPDSNAQLAHTEAARHKNQYLYGKTTMFTFDSLFVLLRSYKLVSDVSRRYFVVHV